MASMVSGASYSASASLPLFESTRLTLKVKPMRSGSAGRRRFAPGLITSPWRRAALATIVPSASA